MEVKLGKHHRASQRILSLDRACAAGYVMRSESLDIFFFEMKGVDYLISTSRNFYLDKSSRILSSVFFIHTCRNVMHLYFKCV